jgi:ribonuclease R
MASRRDTLLEHLRRSNIPLSVQELMRRAGLHPGERTEVKRQLRDLTREGLLARAGKRFSMAGRPEKGSEPGRKEAGATGRRQRGAREPGRRGGRAPPALQRRRGGGVLGTLKKHRDGFGFVGRLDRAGDDIYLPVHEASKALDGDLVRVAIVPGRGGRSSGEILEVVERRRRYLLGTYQARGKSSFVVPSDSALGGQVPVPTTDLARDGEVVKVALAHGSGADSGLTGEVVERVGAPGEARTEVLQVAYANGFADLFPEEVQVESQGVPDQVRPEDRANRRDLTRMRLVTIDGEDARDFDDAVYVERAGGGYRLVVAIADVAHYVRAGSVLDAEALRRGTSVYFPMQVLPMLPERLSNGICSLNPHVDRLCMVADLRIDQKGDPVSAEIYQGVMRSAARCTYTEVAAVLAGEHVPQREGLKEDFRLMAELQEKLTAMRRRRGAIDFDLPEAKVVLDGAGKVTGIEKRPRNRAHRVVEEFMLAANEAVARQFSTTGMASIYRVHDSPDAEKLDAFLALARLHGFAVASGDIAPGALNELLERLRGHPQQRAMNQLLLRAMMQAVYSPENIGHYGLAAEHYLHFTSPIRRYPDLMVHRLLKSKWEGRDRGGDPGPNLQSVAALASDRERAAMQAEREIHGYYAALFMQDKVGQRVPGVVGGVADFGLFVELEPWFVEGLVKKDDLGPGFELDPEAHALVQARTGRSFRVGDRVEVEVENASPARRQIDLLLVVGGVTQRAPARPKLNRREEPSGRPSRGPGGRKKERSGGGRRGPPKRKGSGRSPGRRGRRRR